MIACDILEIGRVVVAGEGVFRPAISRHDVRERAIGIGFRALEHEVFEEMRDARAPGLLIGGADLVPDHLGDDRCAVVGYDDDLHAVVEHETFGTKQGVVLGAQRHGKQEKNGKDGENSKYDHG